MKHIESIKRVIILQLSTLGLLFLSAAYGYMWYKYYSLDVIVKFWNKGNWLVIAIYFVLLLLLMNTYGGTKIGYLKTFDVFLSQVFAILATNILTYAQLSLMCGWFARVKPILVMTAAQIVFSFLWVWISNLFYRNIFPPRQLLLIHGDRPTGDIKRKFASREDRYIIAGEIHVNEGLEALKKEILLRYDGVVIWDIPTDLRNKLVKYCYSQSVRIYLMPKISDVIVMGAERMHLFDTPILLTREYALTIEQRFIKRATDLICAILLIIFTSPIMLITALVIKLSDGGPVFYAQTRCTINNREFKILKFRSMRVDAEKIGGAQLAKKNDPRITPVGRFIRKVRIDELPQLFNIVKGDMSFIGPRPERPEIIAQYMDDMPEFAFRTKVKAGLAGYAQVYGKYNTTPYDKLKLDLTYIENYSTWLDYKLMLLTLKVLFMPDATEGIDANQKTALKTEQTPAIEEKTTQTPAIEEKEKSADEIR
ncbi:MAG: sugar transferase [Lachnospiraceae bacterium]|nr:sugar transferase [Lachnospiraceae bacterium]